MSDYTDSVMTLVKAMEEIKVLQQERLKILLALSDADRPTMPNGWNISKGPRGLLTITDPNGTTVKIGFLPKGSQVAKVMLRNLAEALLAAAPQAGETK